MPSPRTVMWLLLDPTAFAPKSYLCTLLCMLQASWWYVMPADAVELVRVSSLKTVKALQTVAKFFAQVCTDIARHRCELSASTILQEKHAERPGILLCLCFTFSSQGLGHPTGGRAVCLLPAYACTFQMRMLQSHLCIAVLPW